jgi:uncharacterized membrane protein YbaN (DUF454 family)
MIAAGTLFLLIGVTGIFVPGLPTTPFLLLTAGLYIRSSDRLYQKLLRNPWLGSYIADWQSSHRLSLKTKVASIGLMWLMIGISVGFAIESQLLRVIIILTGMTGTLVMGFLIPTAKK